MISVKEQSRFGDCSHLMLTFIIVLLSMIIIYANKLESMIKIDTDRLYKQMEAIGLNDITTYSYI